MIKELVNNIKLNLKIQFRIPISVFFSLFFPLIMMLVMVTSYKNFSIGNGYHFVDKYLFISVGIGLIPLTVISFPMDIGSDIENKRLKRLEYLNINLNIYLIAKIISFLLLSILSILTNIIFAKLIFNAKIPSLPYLLAYFIQCEYCVLVSLILGACIALIIKNTKIILPLGMIILFTFYAFSGTFVQYDQLAKQIQKISKYLPWKYLMNDFFKVWDMSHFWNITFIKLNTLWLILLSIILIIIYSYKLKNKG